MQHSRFQASLLRYQLLYAGYNIPVYKILIVYLLCFSFEVSNFIQRNRDERNNETSEVLYNI